MYIYEVRPRNDKRGVDLISDALPFGRLWYGEPNAVSNAIGYAEHRSRSHDAVIRIYDAAGNVIETHKQAVASSGDFGSIADLMRTRLRKCLGGMPLHENLPADWNTTKIRYVFSNSTTAAIDEERFAVPTGRPYHVLRHHHSRLPR